LGRSYVTGDAERTWLTALFIKASHKSAEFRRVPAHPRQLSETG